MENRTYIAPLDGLRAIAILLVLVFHLNESYLKGGFIGVDVFFVVSGYIISRNILTECREGSFSLVNFYHRRIARLMPSAIVTVVISLIAASFIYPEHIVSYFSYVGLLSIISLSNIFFYFNTGYFDQAASNNIFLHMWSLSVEEQFYLFWPLFLLGILKSKIGNKFLSSFLILILSVFFAGSWYIYTVDQTAAFFLMPARMFQFAAGALVAVYHLRENPQGLLSPSAPIFLLGIACIACSAAFSNGDEYRFGIATALPTAGAALAILAIDSSIARRLLGNTLATAIGRRAYPIYLVHWPLIVMASIFYGTTRPLLVDMALFCACLVLAEILRFSVEQPFRLTKAVSRWNGYRTIAIAGLFVASVGFATVWPIPVQQASTGQVARQTTVGPYTRFVRENHELRMRLGRYDQRCTIRALDEYSLYNYKDCMTGDGSPKVLLIGDSMTGEANIMLSKILPSNMMLIAGVAGCAVYYPTPLPTSSETCIKLNDERLLWANRDDVVAIAVITQWYWQDEKRINSLLHRLKDTGKPIILFGARPAMTIEVPALVDGRAGSIAAQDLTAYLKFTGKDKMNEIKTIIKEFESQVVYVDMASLMCPEKCTAYTPKGVPIYIDAAHITAPALLEFADEISRKYGAQIRSIVGLPVQEASSGR